MSRLTETHERFGASFREVGGTRVPDRYARADRSRTAVRSGVGVTEHPWGLVSLEGEDREVFLDDTITCVVPPTPGRVRYGFLLDPGGTIETDLYVVNAGERLVCLTPPGVAADLAGTWAERVFIQDVTVADITDDHAVFGVHGPAAAAKLSSVMPRGEPPADPMSMVRGVVRDHGTTLVRIDAPIGEPGILVVCRRPDAAELFDGLVSLGMAAVPFGYATWSALTLEAGTPTFEHELAGRQPNVCGQLGTAVDLSKGCFIGQEVVARVANLGQLRERLVGLHLEVAVAPKTTLYADGAVGEITRAAAREVGDGAIAMAVVRTTAPEALSVGDDGQVATIAELPFVEGSEPTARLPTYADLDAPR